MHFELARNIDDAWSAVDLFPLQPGDPRYVDCSQVRGNTLERIKRMLKRHAKAKRNLHLLFTGYRGNGKTTELYQLQSIIKSDYEVIYFDVSELDVNNLTLSDLLLVIAKITVEGMTKAGYCLPDNLLENVGDWFFEKVLERSEKIIAEIGAKADIGIPDWFSFITTKIFSGVQMSTDDRQIMRRKLERDITELIDKVNSLLRESRARVQDKGKVDLIFIMDSLDRLRLGLDKNLFQGSGSLLKQLQANFIYVVPISLFYDEQATLLPFDEQLILPMIPIYKGGYERILNEVGIEHLKKVVEKRLVVEEVFACPQKTVDELILASGGHLRDLMKLIGFACNETEDKIQPHHAERAINKLIRDYEKVIRDEEYEHIVTVYQTQDPPNNETNQKLIYNNVILVYTETDETEWKDVHPAVVKNNKFQKALKQR
ncbi:MAG: hypothetical protein QNJ54_12780 [Prochloraceae cyanobacterium]|nr:hypothetical protein [Prochloraceae cyanobacterium]